jgi:uncharacterized phage protein gp47/JayE
MVTIRNTDNIISGLLDFLSSAQPDLDTKPGTVARDLFVDLPANTVSLLYQELSQIIKFSSLKLIGGVDLDNYAKNYSLTRNQSTTSTGDALLTFNSIPSNFGINKGSVVYSKNGLAYNVRNNIFIQTNNTNYYKSTASKYKNDLDFLGIKDQYAVVANVECSSPGLAGRASKYAINTVNISGINNVTNVVAFINGSDAETDSSFRARILSAFTGSSVGTAMGYLNAALASTNIIDALVIEPGNPLMTRDGTVVVKNADSSLEIISEGSGGKVDVICLGSDLVENIDSFVYKDKSNSNDPSNSKNDFVLGQITGYENKTILQKRLELIKKQTLPAQPTNAITSVTGTLSGSNFKEKVTDQYGRVTGNYELLKDTASFGGSPWGFDKFHWISDRIKDLEEDKIKGQLNGKDQTFYSDVTKIAKITQNILITSENSKVTTDNTIIQLNHTPCTAVTRVFNLTTGERYLIVNQNPSGTGLTNTTGKVKISGSTLPSSNDVLQVDYTWIINYDNYSDFDGKVNTYNTRESKDSIDWGYSSLVRSEQIVLNKDISNNFFTGYLTHNISAVNHIKSFELNTSKAVLETNGTYINRYKIQLLSLNEQTTNVFSIKNINNSHELSANCLFTSEPILVAGQIKYNTTIILQQNTSIENNSIVEVLLNAKDISLNSSFETNKITIPSANINTSYTTQLVDISYIADSQLVYSSAISSLPASCYCDGFLLNSNAGRSSQIINSYRHDVFLIKQNISSQYYIDLGLSDLEYDVTVDYVINQENNTVYASKATPATIIVNNHNYEVILSGTLAINTPVIAIYSVRDKTKNQLFTYTSELLQFISKAVVYNPISSEYYVSLSHLTNASSLSASIIDGYSSSIYSSFVDGAITDLLNGTAEFTSAFNFNTIGNLLSLKLNITSGSDNNRGIYNILSYNSGTNKLVISKNLDKVEISNIIAVRTIDNKEIPIKSISNNKLILDGLNSGDIGSTILINVFESLNVKQAPSKISVTISDQQNNSGTINIAGITLTKIDAVFSVTANGLKQNFADAIRSYLGLSSVSQISSNIRIARLSFLEKVNTVSINSNEILNVVATYDVLNSSVKDNNLYKNELIIDSTLSNTEVIISGSVNNLSNPISLGDKLHAVFYISTENDNELLSFSRNGTLITNKTFAYIDKISIASGFSNISSARIIATMFNQPISNTRYKTFYDYIAPKTNERITINTDYNRALSDVTLSIEKARPINADVIAKEATALFVNASVAIIIKQEYLNSSATVIQNVKDALITVINTDKLAAVLDQSDLLSAASTVDGVDRVRVLVFNLKDQVGTVLSIVAQQNEYLVSNNLSVTVETR